MKQKVTFIMLMVLALSLLASTGIIAQESQVAEEISEGRALPLKEFIG